MNLIEFERSLIGDMWTSTALESSLSYLCDACNGRFAGSDDERRAGDYMLERLRTYGLHNVRAESFAMQGWQRSNARLALLDGGGARSDARELPCLALAGSPPGRVEAQVVDVGPGTPADFERLGNGLAGKVVLAGPGGPHRLVKYAHSIAAGARAFLFANGRPGMLAPQREFQRASSDALVCALTT